MFCFKIYYHHLNAECNRLNSKLASGTLSSQPVVDEDLYRMDQKVADESSDAQTHTHDEQQIEENSDGQFQRGGKRKHAEIQNRRTTRPRR